MPPDVPPLLTADEKTRAVARSEYWWPSRTRRPEPQLFLKATPHQPLSSLFHRQALEFVADPPAKERPEGAQLLLQNKI